MFISDNGRPMPRDKTTLYDSGAHAMDCSLARQGQGRHGESESGEFRDIARTFMDLAGAKYGDTFVGKSFAPMLENPKASIRDYLWGKELA